MVIVRCEAGDCGRVVVGTEESLGIFPVCPFCGGPVTRQFITLTVEDE